ncbi:MAG: GNAT family N-acetyltransferase [Candidatus Cloacimonetes bacterium]|nr:GNAT family N-acetyltransferase [Candidatus Cloacimonadota bacterium]
MKSKNRFINTFVNEMYAILIGIGIGNILFGQGLDFGNIMDLVMVFFVTTVVLKYWWDWTEYISDNVVSSKREFALDFMILILLEFLFGFYNQPQKIALIFLGLAALNLLWVINHLLEFKEKNKPKANKWLLEKVLAVMIFSVVLLIIVKFGDLLPHYLEVAMIIIGYFVVRKVSFRQLKDKKGTQIRAAVPEDAETITELNNSALHSKSPSGFMISKLEVRKVREQIKTGETDFHVIFKKKGKILGFIEISKSADNSILEEVDWIDFFQKDRFEKGDGRYIEKIVIKPENRNKDLGKTFYEYLFDNYRDHLLYAFITIKPINNQASMNFHEKNDFIKSAIFTSKEYSGLKNYQSVMMIKR